MAPRKKKATKPPAVALTALPVRVASPNPPTQDVGALTALAQAAEVGTPATTPAVTEVTSSRAATPVIAPGIRKGHIWTKEEEWFLIQCMHDARNDQKMPENGFKSSVWNEWVLEFNKAGFTVTANQLHNKHDSVSILLT